MREILFRGKRDGDGEWVMGDRAGYSDYVMIWDLIDKGVGYLVDPATVGQFTGLCDKNGVKIFEGDIIKTDYHELKMVVCYNTRLASFSLENGHWMYPHYFEEAVRTKDVEVLGNIHDTPDLETKEESE